MSIYNKLSKVQISKIIHSGEIIGPLLGELADTGLKNGYFSSLKHIMFISFYSSSFCRRV